MNIGDINPHNIFDFNLVKLIINIEKKIIETPIMKLIK